MVFDVKTLMFLSVIINIINAGTMLIIWQRNRTRYKGISFWFSSAVSQAAGSLLILFRGLIPDILSIVLANTLILIGVSLLFIGLSRFMQKRASPIFNWIVVVFFMASLVYFSFLHPDITMREILISAGMVLISTRTCWLLFRGIDAQLRKDAVSTGIILAIYIIGSIGRILFSIQIPKSNGEFFNSSMMDSISLTFYITLNACMNISLALMVNHRLIREIKIQEEKFTIAFHSSPYAILLTRQSDGYVFEANEGFMDTTGYRYDEIIGKKTTDLDLWVDSENRRTVMENLEKGIPCKDQEFRFHKKSGEIIIGLFSTKIIRINNESFVLSSISDITEVSRMKQQLEELASHDFLTGLPNRMMFYNLFEKAIPDAMGTDRKLAILSLDLDNFKSINDLYGHGVGDSVLVEVARRLQSILGEKDIAARLGGDEFIILLYGIVRKEDVAEVVRKILESLSQQFRIRASVFSLSVSIGIALFPENAGDMESLIFKSDEAMYYVKEHGKNNYQFYSEM